MKKVICFARVSTTAQDLQPQLDKAAMQRHIIGRYKTKGVAEQKAREWIDSQ